MNPELSLKELLKAFREGRITEDEAMSAITGLRLDTVGGIATIDTGRINRCGIPEFVLAEGKVDADILDIAREQLRGSGRSIITRIGKERAETVISSLDNELHFKRDYNEYARILVITGEGFRQEATGGKVAVLSAGTADMRVAEEARIVAEQMGCFVKTAYDVGVAGIHRLFPALKDLSDAHVFVVAAGREGTLPSIVAGLVDQPVIGVPVSTGYGYMGKGEAALASMLQSCSMISVVNIDAGIVAGAQAARIANMVALK